MKRFFSVYITVALLFSMMSLVSAKEGIVTITGTSATKGNLVDVRVFVKGTADTIVVVPKYDKDAFLLYEVKDNGKIGEAAHGKNPETGIYQLKWENCGNVDGEVAILTFLVKESAEIKNYTFSAETDGFAVVSGFIGVTESMPGDVTEDGILDVNDVENIKKYSAKWDGYCSSESYTGDVNGDGKVDIADAVIIARAADGWDGYLIDSEREEFTEIVLVEADGEEI